MEKKKLFYGWIIVAAGILCMAVTVGVNNCASQFVKPVCADLGFSRQQMNANQTVVALGGMLLSLFSGKFYARFRLKSVLCVGSVAMGLSVFAYSAVSSLPLFYLISAVLGVCNAMITVIPFSIIIGNWFRKRYGLAIGLAFMGSGVGGMVLNALLGQWIPALGWRASYRLLAGIMLAVLVVCTFFVIRIHPSELGMEPYGAEGETALGQQKQGGEEGALLRDEGVLLKDALRTSRFWAIVGCTGVISIAINVLNQSVAPHLNDVGYSVAFSAGVVSAGYAGLAIGKILLGQLFDRIGNMASTLIAGGALLLGLAGLAFAQALPMLTAIVVGVGLGCAFGSVAYPIITRSLFGPRDYSAIYGVVVAASNCGGIIAPIFSGGIFDRSGSYVPAFFISMGFGLVGIAVYVYQFARMGKRGK